MPSVASQPEQSFDPCQFLGFPKFKTDHSSVSSQEQLDRLLAEWKEKTVKPAWRARVKEWHPDRHHAAPPEIQHEMSERTKLANAIWNQVKDLQLTFTPPQPRFQVLHFSGSASTSSSVIFNSMHITIIRTG